jgi:SAM-dependent methyltransferase
VAYGSWVVYIHELLSVHKSSPNSVLDLACGTGTVSLMLAERGYDVTGVDISSPMVEQARRKAAERGANVAFFAQDACELSLERSFDLAICLFDSLNYITDLDRLRSAFSATFRHLRPGGLFIFDLNTEYAFSNRLFDQRSGGNPEYVWKSRYDKGARICTVRMRFKVKDHDPPLEFEELHVQRAYTAGEIDSLLSQAGFSRWTSYHAYTLLPPGPQSDRVFYVAERAR